jgi:putative spermidine/putrescine transport system ATP-binding protein
MKLDVRDLDVLFGAREGNGVGVRSTLRVPLLPVETSALTAKYPGAVIGLAGVTFAVAGGDCLAVLGESGSGKSSLLRTLAGLQPTVRGDVLVNGREVSALPPEHRNVVYLHQEPVLFPHLSVLDNVAFPMVVRGVERKVAERKALGWLERLQGGGFNGFFPQSLSGGQRHRVALARALCAEPDVLLLDEPLASLDPEVRRDVRAALLEARKASGAAMVLVTHDLEDALAVATHVSAIEWATLTTPSEPSALLQSPPSLGVARLLGVYAEIRGEIVTAGNAFEFRWPGGSFPAREMSPGRAVACVRPHELVVQRSDATDHDALTVTARRDGAHDALLDVRSASGDTTRVRVALGCVAAIGDLVTVTLTRASLFPLHSHDDV